MSGIKGVHLFDSLLNRINAFFYDKYILQYKPVYTFIIGTLIALLISNAK